MVAKLSVTLYNIINYWALGHIGYQKQKIILTEEQLVHFGAIFNFYFFSGSPHFEIPQNEM